MMPLAASPLPNAVHNERSGMQLLKKKKKKSQAFSLLPLPPGGVGGGVLMAPLPWIPQTLKCRCCR